MKIKPEDAPNHSLHCQMKVSGAASRKAIQTAESGIGSLKITDGLAVIRPPEKVFSSGVMGGIDRTDAVHVSS